MKLPDRKFLWRAGLTALLLLGAGCSGINTSQSVSPAGFFLPGLMQTSPPPCPLEQLMATNEPAVLLVQSQ